MTHNNAQCHTCRPSVGMPVMRALGVLGALALVVYVVKTGIVWPFFFGWLLAYIYRPFVLFLSRGRVPYSVAVVIPFVLTYLVFGIVFIALPDYMLNASHTISSAFKLYNIENETERMYSYVKHLHPRMGTIIEQHGSELVRLLVNGATYVVHHSIAMAQGSVSLFFVPIIGFNILKKWHDINSGLYALFPVVYRRDMRILFMDMARILGHYLHGQFMIALVLSVYYIAALTVLGVHYSVGLGFFSGFMVFLPYIGFVIGATLSMVALVVQYDGFHHVVPLLCVYIAASLTEASVLTPVFLRKKTGLHPLWIFFFIYAGFKIGGVYGVMAALPIGCMMSILVKRCYGYYTHTLFFQQGFRRSDPVLPIKES